MSGVGFQTLSRRTIQTRRETLAFYLAPLLAATPLWLAVLIASGFLSAPLVLTCAYFALAANVAGSAVDVYSVWEILRLPRDSLVYNTEYRTVVARPASSEDTSAR